MEGEGSADAGEVGEKHSNGGEERDIRKIRNYGFAGALLSFLGSFIPYLGIALFLAGIMLLIIAVKEFSEAAGNEQIFRDYLIAVVLMIAAVFLMFFFMGFSVISAGILKQPEHMMGGILISFLIFWILACVASYFLMRSYSSIADASGVGLFRITGISYLAGAISLIIMIGFLILFVARILEIVAFLSLPEKLQVS